MPTSVCLAFFSPCGYALPQQHLQRTLAWLADEPVETVLAQVVAPGQSPQAVPRGVKSLVYESSDVLFFKENLLNLAAAQAAGSDLLLLDCDITFSPSLDWGRLEESLRNHDIVQPFGTAVWKSQDGDISHARRSAAFAIARGYEPSTSYYHPGFAWAMTRRAWEFTGGLFERHPIGGGDLAFAYSLDQRWLHVDLTKKLPHDGDFAITRSYEIYRHRAASLRLRVGCLDEVQAIHSWHGDACNRSYSTRNKFVALCNGEYPLRTRADGLLEWTDSAASESMKQYFYDRREDG